MLGGDVATDGPLGVALGADEVGRRLAKHRARALSQPGQQGGVGWVSAVLGVPTRNGNFCTLSILRICMPAFGFEIA